MSIEVLGQDRKIPARSYLDVTPETHGEKQLAFDRLYEAFRALHEQAQKDGTPVSDPKRSRYAGRDGRPASRRLRLPRQHRKDEPDRCRTHEEPPGGLPGVASLAVFLRGRRAGRARARLVARPLARGQKKSCKPDGQENQARAAHGKSLPSTWAAKSRFSPTC